MNKLLLFLLVIVFNNIESFGQSKDEKTTGNNVLNPDHTITTEHSVTVKGAKIPYKAIAGTIPVYND